MSYNKKSFHPKPNTKTDYYVEAGSSALGNFFCIVLALIVIAWLCADTSAGLTASLHHEPLHEVNLLKSLGLI